MVRPRAAAARARRRSPVPHEYPAGGRLGAEPPQPELLPSPAATVAQMVAQAGQGDGVTVADTDALVDAVADMVALLDAVADGVALTDTVGVQKESQSVKATRQSHEAGQPVKLHGPKHAPPTASARAAWSPASARRLPTEPHVYPAGGRLGAVLPQPECVPSPAATAAQMAAQAGQGDVELVAVTDGEEEVVALPLAETVGDGELLAVGDGVALVEGLDDTVGVQKASQSV